jgi:hypothetical protein
MASTRHGLPLYKVVVGDDDGQIWPIATALLLSNTSEMVTKFLEVVRTNLGNDEWAPTMMINKDHNINGIYQRNDVYLECAKTTH